VLEEVKRERRGSNSEANQAGCVSELVLIQQVLPTRKLSTNQPRPDQLSTVALHARPIETWCSRASGSLSAQHGRRRQPHLTELTLDKVESRSYTLPILVHSLGFNNSNLALHTW
jgi:hypothetical protein